MSIIYTVDVAKFTEPKTGEPAGMVDVCRDDEGFVHIRVLDGDGNHAVLRIHYNQARRVRQILDKAIDGIVPMQNRATAY